MLGPATRRGDRLAIALLASLRIGLLAAVLLGPAAAIGVAARMPGLITGARDGFVVAAYLGVVFGAASFVEAWCWCWRQPEPAAGPALSDAARGADGRSHLHDRLPGLPDALVGRVDAGGGDSVWRSGLDAAAGRLAVAISLLLGHLVTVTTLAVVVARSGGDGGMHGVRLLAARAGSRRAR